MFHVKICGVTTAADARMARDAGADAIGINFVPGSPRCVTVEQAREIACGVKGDVVVVGVFAGMAPADILAIVEATGLDAVQLHGHLEGPGVSDPPGTCAALAPLPVIRAIRLGSGDDGARGLAAARRWIDAAHAAGHGPVMAVVDAAVTGSTEAGRLGGTGAMVDWERLAAAGDLGIPMALAGGLTPANVAAGIEATGLAAVDTASGVEASPGCKDPEKVRAFCQAARAAIAALPA